MTIERFEV